MPIVANNIDGRISELSRALPISAPMHLLNCHGTSLYILGVFPDFRWIESKEMKEIISELLMEHHENLSAFESSLRTCERGDLIIFGECNHSGIVLAPSTTNPVIFSKYRGDDFGRSDLKRLERIYGKPRHVFRVE
jgi:hypothetical protein